MPHRVKEIKVNLSNGETSERVVKAKLPKRTAQNWANKLNDKQELPPTHQALTAGKETETPKFIMSYVVEEV